ncbi:hypothetical protein ACLMJK_006334 [Lecanora helva]
MSKSSERMRNEAAALRFIAARTTIPVPKVISFKRVWGAYQLVMERIRGVSLDCIKGVERELAVRNAEMYITSTVLPQLKSLESSTMGALIGGIILPNRNISYSSDQGPSSVGSESEQLFTFCHNDLAQHNIMMDPDSLQVVAIIDWEGSGFYNADFELPLWTVAWHEPGHDELIETKIVCKCLQK